MLRSFIKRQLDAFSLPFGTETVPKKGLYNGTRRSFGP